MDEEGGIQADLGHVVDEAASTRVAVSDDADLVARCLNGDERAWADLVERFARYIYAIAARAYRLAEADAEDVFQEVFARAYDHLKNCATPGRSSPGLRS